MNYNEINDKITSFLQSLNTEISILDFITVDWENNKDLSFDEIESEINNNNGFDLDIIYYPNAIEYLKNNDPSLKESLEIASEFGFSIDNLSSETLASLLYSQNERVKFYNLRDEINEFFDDLRNDNDE